MMKTLRKEKGIGLIEIMVSLIVVAVGILGITKLQSSVVRSASDANNRAMAATLAQNKIDELRSFAYLDGDSLTPANGEYAFSQITDNNSLVENTHTPSGTIISGTGNGQMGAPENTTFTLSWKLLGNYYYDSTSPLTVAAANNSGDLPDFKVVEVVVNWVDIDGTQQKYTARTVIDGYAPIFTAQYGNTTIGSNPPVIPYTPEAAPDVVPVSLETDDGLKKETAKPLPDVSKKGASTSVQFETVTYNTALNTVKREDFKTVACLCTQASAAPTNPDTIQYGTTVWDPENLKLKDKLRTLTAAEKALSYQKSKVDNSGGELQDASCYTCCRDAPDVGGGVDYKACRLKRIDGVYRVYEPWKMIAFNLIPASYFDASAALPTIDMSSSIAEANIDTYSDYVTDLVRGRLALSESSFESSGVDTTFAPDDFQGADSILHRTFDVGLVNNRQLQARAVFMDYPPPEIYNDCASCASATLPSDVVPLNRVSFNEVNLTELAGWNPDRDDLSFPADYTTGHDALNNGCTPFISAPTTRNYVTNDAIENGCETSLSRGMFYPVVTNASEAVQTIIYTSNDGVVDKLINPTASTATATIDLIVQ